MRRLIAFPCEGETLVGSLDQAPRSTGLLIVAGGNEVRTGTARGMGMLAARVAAAGFPVLRYDRRGVGDSTGRNDGFEAGAADLLAAAACLAREQPQVTRLVGLGNCDGATTLALFGRAAGFDGLVLCNPWTGGTEDGLPAATAIRAHYRERLRRPQAWLALLKGGVDFRGLFAGLAKIARSRTEERGSLTGRLADALAGFGGGLTIVLARRDNTAIAFADAWRGKPFAAVRQRAAVVEIDTASHGFTGAAAEALAGAVLASLTSSPRHSPSRAEARASPPDRSRAQRVR